MSDLGITPDLWEINDDSEIIVFAQPNKGIAMIFRAGDAEWGDDAPLHCEAVANARAIVQVPYMIEALRNARSMLRDFRDNSGCIEQIDAILRKIEGDDD